MTWKVKGRDPNGTVHEVLADEWSQALELMREHAIRNRQSWIEDTEGRIMTPQDDIAERYRLRVREMRGWLNLEREAIRRGHGSPEWADKLESSIADLESVIRKHEAKHA